MTTPNLTIIDVVGSIKHVVKLMLLEILYIAIAIFLMLSAPLLFTVGAEYLAYKYPDYAGTWAIVYLAVGPWFCAAWMSPISHWSDWVLRHRLRRQGYDLVLTRTERIGAFTRGVGFMFAGLIGSYVIEGVFTYWAHRANMIPNHLMLYFAIAPFAVFAPCWLVVLSRMVRKHQVVG